MSMNRRSLLGGGVTVGAGVLSASLLGACGPGTRSTPPSAQVGSVALPSYLPYDGARPDLEPTESGATAGFLEFPSTHPQFSDRVAMSGGTLSTFSLQFSIPLEHEKNQWWQDLEARLGARLDAQGVPTGDYTNKLQAMIAGDQLPDCVQFLVTALPARLPQLLESRFQPIDEFVAGDAVKDLPGLANIPTDSWKTAVHNGKIWGVPKHRTLMTRTLVAREDLAADLGLSLEPSDGEEFLELLKGFSDPDSRVFAERSPVNMLHLVGQMMGMPNKWRVTDGTFTSDYESEEMAQALSIVQQMWKDEIFHPESFSGTSQQVTGWVSTGIVRMVSGTGTWDQSVKQLKQADPDASLKPVILPKWDGGGAAAAHLGVPAQSYTVINRHVPAERVPEILQALNYLTAPFGTEESIFIGYGTEGRDFTWENGEPTPLDGPGQVFPVGYIAAPPTVNYMPGAPQQTQYAYDYERAQVDNPAPLPTLGLYSELDSTKGATLARTMLDAQAAVIRGASLDTWTEAVRRWKNSGGDDIAREYEEAAHAAGG